MAGDGSGGLDHRGSLLSGRLGSATHPSQVVAPHFEWNYTTFLNIGSLGVFGVLYWLHRNREKLGGGGGYAIDPVCGMQVEKALAPAQASRGGEAVYFCSDRCRDRFTDDPSRFAKVYAQPGVNVGADKDRAEPSMS